LDEIAGLGLEDYFYGDGVCVVEWAEKGKRLLPPDNLLLSMKYVAASPTGRSIRLKPHGQRYNQLLKQLKVKGGSDLKAQSLDRPESCNPRL
jgi:tRNA threonylcarbamoyladenosine biosynthesis protein TsaE